MNPDQFPLPPKNNKEIEVKYCIQYPDRIEAKIINLGGTLIQPRTHEYNLRFDTPDHDLVRNHQALRLRRDSRVRLTFKGQADWHRRISVRQEIEFRVGSFDSAKQFLHALGYQVTLIYEKYRTTYHLDNLIITIDEMPYGLFMEIEGPNPDEIKDISEKIGLEWQTRLGESYMMLFDRMKKALNLTFSDLTFENFKDVQMGLDHLGIIPADADN